MKKKHVKKTMSEEDRKKMTTAFLIIFPSFIIGFLAIIIAESFLFGILICMLVLYQFTLIKEFIKDYFHQKLI